jgi:hypothetical protein
MSLITIDKEYFDLSTEAYMVGQNLATFRGELIELGSGNTTAERGKVMDKLGKLIAFHPVKSPLSLFYEVIEPDGETRWGGERVFDAICWLHLAPRGSRLLVSGWESDDIDAIPIGQPLDVTELYQMLKGNS